MAADWIILGKTVYDAELLESSREGGVKVASVPFDLAAEFVPDLLRNRDETLEKLTAALPPEAPAFEAIVHRCAEMKRVVARARHVALHKVPVLIEGESGTGKELFARAIHQSSSRARKPFVAINCGAIPPTLVESELFGHKKGGFTGATADRNPCHLSVDRTQKIVDSHQLVGRRICLVLQMLAHVLLHCCRVVCYSCLGGCGAFDSPRLHCTYCGGGGGNRTKRIPRWQSCTSRTLRGQSRTERVTTRPRCRR